MIRSSRFIHLSSYNNTHFSLIMFLLHVHTHTYILHVCACVQTRQWSLIYNTPVADKIVFKAQIFFTVIFTIKFYWWPSFCQFVAWSLSRSQFSLLPNLPVLQGTFILVGFLAYSLDRDVEYKLRVQIKRITI